MAFGGTALVSTKLTALSRALADLAGTVEAGGLDALDDQQLLAFLQELAAVRDRVPAVERRARREVADRHLAETWCPGGS
jgi:hypothetical protein